jgi:hypothetical protein
MFGWLATLLLPHGQAIAQASPSPTVLPFPKTFVGKPEFTTKAGVRSPGTACLATFENNPQIYLLTVRHLLGPAGGFPQLIPPDQMPLFVSSIRLLYLFAPGSKSYRVEALKVPETSDVKAPFFNVAIFKAIGAFKSDTVAVTTDKPAKGETVWVISRVRASNSKEKDIHPAKVANDEARWLICELDDPSIVPNGASGAPVLNASGKIVGIYCTHSNRDGKVFAYVIPSALLAEVVTEH